MLFSSFLRAFASLREILFLLFASLRADRVIGTRITATRTNRTDLQDPGANYLDELAESCGSRLSGFAFS
jgi:hypothetical protein